MREEGLRECEPGRGLERRVMLLTASQVEQTVIEPEVKAWSLSHGLFETAIGL